MNDFQKYLSKSLLATVALLVGAFPAWAQAPDLGAASAFSVLGRTNVTCTAPGSIIGDVGVSPGTFTNTTGCVITGATPPATNAAAALAQTAFLGAYAVVVPKAGDCDVAHTLAATIPVSVTLAPGVYCTNAALTATDVVLTLDGRGDANAVWIFKIGTLATGALTGTNFSVVMANGGQPCNVYWVPTAGVSMTTSAFSGNILAGNATDGSITLKGGTLAGRALANVAVTMTGANVIGCAALPGPLACKDKDRDGDDKGRGKCDDRHDGDKGQGKCNDGHDDDKGHGSDSSYPFGSNDKGDRKSGNSGKW